MLGDAFGAGIVAHLSKNELEADNGPESSKIQAVITNESSIINVKV